MPVLLPAGTIEAHGVTGLYAADFVLPFDTARLAVVDAADDPGVQIDPGPSWPAGQSVVVRNRVASDTGTVHFAASLMRPASPFAGDVVLARIAFRKTAGTVDDAYALTRVTLADDRAGEIAVRWRGVEIATLPPTWLPVVVQWRAPR